MSLFNGLISHWKLEEASGTRVDSHGSNNLTDNNTVGQAAGKIGNAALFVATNGEYLSRTSNASLQMGDVDCTFSLWFYPTSAPGDGHDMLGKWNLDNASNEYFIEIYDDVDGSHVRFRFGDGDLDFVETVALNQWHHVVCWYDAGADTVSYEYDGGSTRSISHSGGSPVGDATFVVGCAIFNGVLTRYFDGRIDEVSIWKRVLTSDERAQLYNNGDGISYSDFSPGRPFTQFRRPRSVYRQRQLR